MSSTATGICAALVLALAVSWFLLPMAWARLLLALGRMKAGLHPGSLTVDGRKWFYLEGGSGPVLLALHGFGADADNWLLVAHGLTRQFRVIAPDLPGFGRSMTDEPLAFDITSQVERLHAFLQALGSRPCILAGNSMGGWIAAAYAARYPDGVAGLWLLAPLGVRGGPSSPLLDAIEGGVNSPFDVSGTRQFGERVWQPLFGKAPWIPYPLKKHYAVQAERLARNAPAMFRQVQASTESLESAALSVSVPVLLQWGDRDRAVNVAGAEPLRRAFDSVTVEIQQGVGHLPMLEVPAASARLFRSFCARHQLI